jgi:hypothetical protein
MARKIEVDFYEWHRLLQAVQSMQGHTFYCEDADGVLRRWYPPEAPAAKPLNSRFRGGAN